MPPPITLSPILIRSTSWFQTECSSLAPMELTNSIKDCIQNLTSKSDLKALINIKTTLKFVKSNWIALSNRNLLLPVNLQNHWFPQKAILTIGESEVMISLLKTSKSSWIWSRKRLTTSAKKMFRATFQKVICLKVKYSHFHLNRISSIKNRRARPRSIT